MSDVIGGSAEEYIGVPVGFMLAGVPCVISSLWAVPDLSTALLMERFYATHLKDAPGFPQRCARHNAGYVPWILERLERTRNAAMTGPVAAMSRCGAGVATIVLLRTPICNRLRTPTTGPRLPSTAGESGRQRRPCTDGALAQSAETSTIEKKRQESNGRAQRSWSSHKSKEQRRWKV